MVMEAKLTRLTHKIAYNCT